MQTENKSKLCFRYRPVQVMRACVISIGLGVMVSLCWFLFSFALGAPAAWIVMILACLGLPGAYWIGRWQPCACCREQQETVLVLEERIVRLLRQQDRLRFKLHEALFGRYQQGKSR